MIQDRSKLFDLYFETDLALDEIELTINDVKRAHLPPIPILQLIETNKVTIGEAVKLRLALTSNIRTLLCTFCEETGLRIETIQINASYDQVKYIPKGRYNIDVNIKNPF